MPLIPRQRRTMDPTAFANNTQIRVGLERLEYATSIDTPGADSPLVVYQSYRDALDRLIPGLSTLTSHGGARQWLQRRIELAMDRAETLQQIVQVVTPRSSPPLTAASPTTTDRSMASALSPARPIQLEEAVALAQRASAAETTGDWQVAYDSYRGALEILVPLALPSWRSRVLRYMERAEELSSTVLRTTVPAHRTPSSRSSGSRSVGPTATNLLTDLQSVTLELSRCRQRVQEQPVANHSHSSSVSSNTSSSTLSSLTLEERQGILQEVQRATLELEGLRFHLDTLQDSVSS